MKLYYLFSIIMLLCCLACQHDKVEIITTQAVDADFEEAKQVSANVADGLVMDLWAPGPLLSNAVALTFDNNGVAYVAETSRRKSSDIDIRQHRDWEIEDLALQTIEDTEAFHLRKLATNLSAENTWQEDFNEDGIHDYRDLEVQSEYIRRVWDSNGDGRADISHLYAEGFNDMLTGVAAGVLNYNDEVFVTAAPDVWRLKDLDNDGVADERTKISHGYGIHIAYAGHDMSGLTIGPDGRLYWSIGDIGANVVDAKGKRWAYPNQGSVMRCNLDGSDFEIFAHGVRNPQELAFDALGNLISVDNDGDHRGEHERYIHILEGSDTGWRINWQFGKYKNPNEAYKVWMDEKLYLPHFPGQAAYLLPPIALAPDGPAGFAFNPGTALSEAWYNYFFASYFKASSAKSKIEGFKLKPNGASFEVEEVKQVVGGIVPTGITFASDGALYINDWKDSYDKKPEGRIWKLTATSTKNKAIQTETQAILKSGLSKKTIAELSQLISHQDQRVRMAAQFELVKRNESTTLLTLSQQSTTLLGRIHAIWGMGQLARKQASEAKALIPLLNDTNENIRAQTAKVLGESKYQPAYFQLIPLLKDKAATVQYFAAEALGKIGNKAAFQPLVDLLTEIEESDPHLRHGIMYALSNLNQEELLASLANHPSKYVRIGAVVALRMLKSPKVANFLKDTEELVLTEAARAINDDFSIPAAMPALAKSLEKTKAQNEAFLRRAINANLRVADAESALRLASYAQQNNAPTAMRQDALWSLGYWADPPVLDRVDNRYRVLSGHKIVAAQAAMETIFQDLVTSKNVNLRASAITAAGRTQFQKAEQEVFDIFKNTTENARIRNAALFALSNLKSKNLVTAINLALTDKSEGLRKDAQSLLEQVDLPKATLISMFDKILSNNSLGEQQKALASLAKLKGPEANGLLQKWVEKLIDKSIPPALKLDVIMAVEKSEFTPLKTMVKEYKNAIDTSDALALYESTLYGGNKNKGMRIMTRNTTAQCLRCHAIKGYGGEVGPALDDIATTLSREDLLLSLVDPNARIAPGYGTVILSLKDGKEIAGILMEETEEQLQIKVGNDPVQLIPKTNIQKRETLPSGMFAIGELLDKSQLRDLMAFLVELKADGDVVIN